jgi:CheY-like chemotaxis protein
MNKKAILCVDDEKIILNSLKNQIRSYFGNRYVLEAAESAEEAWEVIWDLEAEGIQLSFILSDWLMPDVKGDEFLIKVYNSYPEITTVMLTGQADQKAIDNAIENANLRVCLNKPWDEFELMQLIESSVG